MTRIEDIQVLRVQYLRGPGIWTYQPVLEVWLDLGELESRPSHQQPGLTERLLADLPGLMAHHCGVGEPGGFVQRLQTGTWAGHILEHVIIELLTRAGLPTAFGQTRSTSRPGVYRMVFRALNEAAARAALKEGHALLMSAIRGSPFDVGAAVQRLAAVIGQHHLQASADGIVAAARRRRIPHLVLHGGQLVQLGQGASQRRIWASETDHTSAIAQGIAQDDELTHSLLRACGIPTPDEEGSAVGELHRLLVVGHRLISAVREPEGDCQDCTAQVHPDTMYLACLAARTIGLDIAGIDVRAQDIGAPLATQKGVVQAVHSGPDLRPHLAATPSDKSQAVGDAIVSHLFPDDQSGRIPIVGITGQQGSTLLARLVAWLLNLEGRSVGLACRDGLFLERRQVSRDDARSWEQAHRLILHPGIQAAVFESTPRDILEDGLPYDRCTVGIVTDLSGHESLGDHDVFNDDQMIKVVRTQVDVVLSSGSAVLHAADPRIAALAELCDGAAVLYGEDGLSDPMRTHRQKGLPAVFLREEQIVLAQGLAEELLRPDLSWAQPTDLPAILAATAAAHALQLSSELIVTGLETFDPKISPARPLSGFSYAR